MYGGCCYWEGGYSYIFVMGVIAIATYWGGGVFVVVVWGGGGELVERTNQGY